MKTSTWVAVMVLAGVVGWKIYTQPVRAEHRHAPEGTFFLTEYVSFPTRYGMTGVEPGEMVHLVKVLDAAQKLMRVACREGEFDVSADQLTTDMDLAETIRQQDQAGQFGSHEKALALQQSQADQQRSLDEASAKSVQQTSVAMSAAPAGGGPSVRSYNPTIVVNTYYPSNGGMAGGTGSTAGTSGGAVAPAAAGGHPSGNAGASASSSGSRDRYTQDPATRLQLQSGGSQPAGATTWH